MPTNKEQTGFCGFIQLCLALKNAEQAEEFFDLFMTPQDKQDFAARFLIVKELLKNGKSQRDMAADLNVSIAKITRGSNSLKKCSKELTEFIKQYTQSV